MTKEIFANNLKILRKQYNMTQDQLSKVLNVKRSQIGAWEEKRAWPNVPTLIQIGQAFGQIDIYKLVTTPLR